jgi:hypothetical protein
MNPDFQPLADELYRERVLRARRTPPEERLLDGIRLYDEALERMKIGVRLTNPQADEAEVNGLLQLRVRRLWKLSDHGYFRPA